MSVADRKTIVAVSIKAAGLNTLESEWTGSRTIAFAERIDG